MTKPGTDTICGMIRPECKARAALWARTCRPSQARAGSVTDPPRRHEPPFGTAMQTKPGKDVICDTICPEGTSRPVGTATEYAFVPRGRDAPALQRRPQVSLRAPIPGFVNMPEKGQLVLANEFYSQSAVLTPEERLEALRAAQRLVTYALTKYGWLDGLTSAEDID